MKKIISIIGCLFLITACGNKIKYQTIDSNEAMELINNESTVIVDVRTVNEYNEGHIKDAINISVDNIDKVNYDKNTTIIIYCATGVRSSTAADKLISLGYTKVYNLDGGLINWGFELVN